MGDCHGCTYYRRDVDCNPVCAMGVEPMRRCWRHPANVLVRERHAIREIVHACGVPFGMWLAAECRIEARHREHGDDVATLDTRTEACEELLDFINYAALARMQNRWSWRWRLAGWLVGLAWRVLR